MKELNKEEFSWDLELPAVKAANADIQTLVMKLKPLLYWQLRVNKVKACSETHKYIHLKVGTTIEQVHALTP